MTTDYLNRGFLGTGWPQASDLISNEIITRVWEWADQQGLHLHVSDTSVNLDGTPKFTSADSNLKLRLPGSGFYSLSAEVESHQDYFFDPVTWISASFAVEMGIDSTGLTRQDTPVDATGDAGVSTPVATGMSKGLGNLGFFQSIRYDPSTVPVIPSPQLHKGYSEFDPDKAIDIVLVSDGFTSADMSDFVRVVDAAETALSDPNFGNANEPYLSFSTAIRLWTMKVPSTDPANLLHRVVAQYHDETEMSSLANLARMNAIGLIAETVGANVVVSCLSL